MSFIIRIVSYHSGKGRDIIVKEGGKMTVIAKDEPLALYPLRYILMQLLMLRGSVALQNPTG